MDAPRTEDEIPDYEILDFHWDTSHGHIVTMLQRRPARGIVLDLGCGSAPLAEPLRDAGFTYVGLDVNEHCLTALRRRGFAAQRLDLRHLDSLAGALDGAHAQTLDVTHNVDAVAGDADANSNTVVAVLALDVIEHLVDPHVALHGIASWMQGHGVQVLGLSVPNVTHRDLAVKLLNARWELTGSGLLDATHLRFFTDRSLGALAAACGLHEIDRMDSIAEWSDQHHPVGSPALHTTTPLGRFLADLRARADRHGATYQFVRLFEPADVPVAAPSLPVLDPAAVDVRLAVVVPAAATDSDLMTLRADLDAQTSAAWQLVSATAWADAPCSHVAVVGAGQRLGPRWVAQFVEAGAVWHGMILRCAPDPSLALDPAEWPVADDPADLDGKQMTPPAAWAFPIAALEALGHGIGDASSETVQRLVRDVAPYCGIHDTRQPAVGAPADRADDHLADDHRADDHRADDHLADDHLADDDRADDHRADCDRADQVRPEPDAPVLVERWVLDELAALRRSAGDRAEATAVIDALDARGEMLAQDNDWLNAELRRTPVRILRRLLRRPARRE